MHSKTQKQKQTLMMKLLQLVWNEKGAYFNQSMD